MKRLEAQKKIRWLASEGKIKFCSQDVADKYKPEIKELLLKVFCIKGAWVSDESMCSDFTFKRAWRRKAVQAFNIGTPAINALVIDVAKAIRVSRQH